MTIQYQVADYTDPKHADDLVMLMDHYASDPMGGGEPLNENVKAVLASELAKQQGAVSIIAYDSDQAVGLLNAFTGFSTFAAKPLMNIHDVVVLDGHRGKGISQGLINALVDIAKGNGCVKLTLEVLQNNHIAKGSYTKLGFKAYELDPASGHAEFWQKYL